MTYFPFESWRANLYSGLIAAIFALPAMGIAQGPLTTVLADFESNGGAVAVTTGNSHASGNSNSVATMATETGSGRLVITDSDGGSNGVLLNIPGGIPGPGYYLFTADVKVDNAGAPIQSYGMGLRDGGPGTELISDVNAGYVMNLSGSGDAALGYQTIGAAIEVANTGSFPRDVAIYFGTDVSGNTYNAPAVDGDFANAHRSGAASWSAGSSNAVYVDNVKRIGPGNMGEERHLWISVGDGYTNLTALEDILVKAKANNFTAVDILARYRADAYYVPNRTDATYANPEPFGSRVGTVNASPENDPLQYAIDRCRQLGLRVYISFSTFLVTPNSTYPSTLPNGSIMGILPSGSSSPRDMVSADNSNEGLWADLGRQDVRDYTKNILMDIVSNYDIDGVVLDRVRYPGTRFGYNPQALSDLGFSSAPSPFSAAFRDARRDVITDFIQECYEAVTTKKPWVVMGMTPVAFGIGMTDTYNNVLQYWPSWTSRKTANRTVDFGCVDLMQPQFYRLAGAAPPNNAPVANDTLMKKAQFGDVATASLDFGLMPGAYTMVAPTFFHPSSGDANQSKANAQNITDARALAMSGFGLFAAKTTLNDINLIRAASASSAGTDVLAGTPTKVDYLFKAGYDSIAPNAVTNFTATPQARGSVVLEWEDPAPAADGETASNYVIYKSKSQPVQELYANQVTKLPVSGNWAHVPVGEAGSWYYRIVPIDDYNNRGASTEIGPFTVTGVAEAPADIIIDNTAATVVGAWTTGTFAGDKYGINYLSRGAAIGDNKVIFNATLPVSGSWTVSEWHNQGSNRAPDARHLVQHDGGTATVLKDQRSNGGKWNALASYNFTAGNSYSVTIDDIFTNLGGSVVIADAIRFSYAPEVTVTPAQPTNLTATAAGTSQINLTWNDVATNESGYELERTISGGTTIIISLPADTTSYSDTALATDTEYVYVIRAYTSGAQSADSNIAAARTMLAPPDDIIIDNPQAQFAGLWSTGTGAGKFGPDYKFVSKGSGLRTATFSFTPQRTAVYDVYEWHVGGTNRAADAPHTVSHAGGSSLVVVNQTLNGAKWNKIGSWLFNANGTYSVVLSDQYLNGTVMMADAIKVVYNAEPPTTPAAPSALAATAISDTEIGLTWSDNAVNESGYEIERTRDGGTAEIISALPADSVSYIDTGLNALTQYTYVVRAINSQGVSGNSNIVSATTLSSTPPDQIIDNTQADLVGPWTISTATAEKYGASYAFRGKSATGANYATFAFVARDNGLYEISEWHPQGTNRPNDAPHIIQHQGGADTVLVNQQINGGMWNPVGTFAFSGGSNYSVTISDKFLNGTVIMADAIKIVYVGEIPPAPAAPTGVNATGVGASQVDLGWTDTTDNESGFEIVRNGSVLTTVGPNVTSYSDTAASECITYTYTVRSVAYGVRSADSTADSARLDATAPVVTAPTDVALNTDAGSATASGANLGVATVSDNCDNAPAVSNNAPASFPIGETIVTYTATDTHGNTGTATQKITVTDVEAPVITAPADVTVVADTAGCFAIDVALGLPTASDNTGVASVVNDAPTTYSVGSTTVTWTATDAYGNAATATQTVTVQDNAAQAPATVSAVAQAWDRIEVTWADVSNETLFEVRYATQLAGPYTVAGSTPADVTSFIIGNLLPNTTYYFAVEARNACGSADGPVAQTTTPLYSGSASDPEASDTWDFVSDDGAEGGSYYIRARRSSNDAASWSMNVPVSGSYQLSVYIPAVSHLSTQANYTVSNGGTNSTTVINQRQNSGSWVVLGTYSLQAGPVTVSVFQPNNSQNPVVVDALNIEQLN